MIEYSETFKTIGIIILFIIFGIMYVGTEYYDIEYTSDYFNTNTKYNNNERFLVKCDNNCNNI
jgi:hypothetical protein